MNDILDAAAMKHGQLHLRLGQVHLKEVAQAVLHITAPLCKPAVTLVDSVPDDIPPICGDFDRLVQVLLRLRCARRRAGLSAAGNGRCSPTWSETR